MKRKTKVKGNREETRELQKKGERNKGKGRNVTQREEGERGKDKSRRGERREKEKRRTR